LVRNAGWRDPLGTAGTALALGLSRGHVPCWPSIGRWWPRVGSSGWPPTVRRARRCGATRREPRF